MNVSSFERTIGAEILPLGFCIYNSFFIFVICILNKIKYKKLIFHMINNNLYKICLRLLGSQLNLLFSFLFRIIFCLEFICLFIVNC